MLNQVSSTLPAGEQPPGRKFGYVRTSTRQQKTDRQTIALLEQGVPRRNIFIDKQSGKDFNRENYQKLMHRVKPGDCIFVKELDRFGRNYEEIIQNWQHITKKMGVDIVVLECRLLDTRIKNDDLTGRLICDMLLAFYSYLAEMERRKNQQRQAEGIAIAKEEGIKFGRPTKERTEYFEEMAGLWQEGKISGRAAAKALNIAPITFKEWAQDLLCLTQ